MLPFYPRHSDAAIHHTGDKEAALVHRPNEGTLRFGVDYSPMASPEFEGGRHSEAAMEMIRLLEQVLRNSRAVDREALCVLAGQKVRSWCAG